MVAVGETLSLPEEVDSLLIVEVVTDLFSQRQMNNVEISILGLLHPNIELGALKVDGRPVPSGL